MNYSFLHLIGVDAGELRDRMMGRKTICIDGKTFWDQRCWLFVLLSYVASFLLVSPSAKRRLRARKDFNMVDRWIGGAIKMTYVQFDPRTK